MIRRMAAIVKKDLLLEWRGPQALIAMVVFGAAVLLALGFTMQPGRPAPESMTAGLLWVVLYFSGLLGLYRMVDMEKSDGCLEALRLAPIGLGTVFLAKWFSATALVLLGDAVLLPLFIVFFNQPVAGSVFQLAAVVVLGTSAFCAVGTLFSSVTSSVRYREVLLPALLLPAVAPVLIAATICTRGLLDGRGLQGGAFGWNFLLGCNIIYILLSYLLYPAVLED